MLDKEIKLSSHMTVGLPPSDEMLQSLADRGFKTVVSLRNKGEAGQIFSPEEEGEKVKALEMKFVNLPVSMSSMKKEHVDEFCQLAKDCPKPIFVHCGFGQRCVPFAFIYDALRKSLTADSVFEKAEKHGITFRAPMLRAFIEGYFKDRTVSSS